MQIGAETTISVSTNKTIVDLKRNHVQKTWCIGTLKTTCPVKEAQKFPEVQ